MHSHINIITLMHNLLRIHAHIYTETWIHFNIADVTANLGTFYTLAAPSSYPHCSLFPQSFSTFSLCMSLSRSLLLRELLYRLYRISIHLLRVYEFKYLHRTFDMYTQSVFLWKIIHTIHSHSCTEHIHGYWRNREQNVYSKYCAYI